METGRVCFRTSDLALALLLLGGGLLGTAGAAANHGGVASAAAYVLTVAACLPVAIVGWRPAWAVALTGAAVLAYVGLGYAYGPILFALVVVVYRLTETVPVRWALTGAAALAGACVGAVAVRAATAEPQTWPDFVSAVACVALPAAIGIALRVRRDATADLRDEQSRRAVSEERLRLAQEVHDEVGHGLAVIALQAGVALRMLDRDPARARQALEAIQTASRGALDGVRAELAALRHPALPAVPLRPAGGLADLPGLASRIRSSGLPVVFEVDDGVTLLGLPPEVDRSAYRIVQESLTNVVRHGGPGATARVRVELAAGALRLEITDTGRGAPAGAHGQGIDGMRARAEALGGFMEATSPPEGGFAVRVRLPVPERAVAAGERR